jgi:hypothetical protein
MMKSIVAQFGHPSGLIGHLVGRLMARKNRERIAWAVDLLAVQPTDQVLEVGFGPGVAIEQVAKLAPAGFVAGIDHSAVSYPSRPTQASARAWASGGPSDELSPARTCSWAEAPTDALVTPDA